MWGFGSKGRTEPRGHGESSSLSWMDERALLQFRTRTSMRNWCCLPRSILGTGTLLPELECDVCIQIKSPLRKERWQSSEAENMVTKKKSSFVLGSLLSRAASHAGTTITFLLPLNPSVPRGEDSGTLRKCSSIHPVGWAITHVLKCRNASQLVLPGHFLLRSPFQASARSIYMYVDMCVYLCICLCVYTYI